MEYESNYLIHWGKGKEADDHKYISREWKNGRWQYTYNIAGKTGKLNLLNKAAESSGANARELYKRQSETAKKQHDDSEREYYKTTTSRKYHEAEKKTDIDYNKDTQRYFEGQMKSSSARSERRKASELRRQNATYGSFLTDDDRKENEAEAKKADAKAKRYSKEASKYYDNKSILAERDRRNAQKEVNKMNEPWIRKWDKSFDSEKRAAQALKKYQETPMYNVETALKEIQEKYHVNLYAMLFK